MIATTEGHVMRSAVVFYSLEGSTRRVAQAVAQRLGSDLIELVCEDPYPAQGRARLLRGSKDAMTGAKPALKPYAFDAAAYDLVIVAGPLWCGKMAAPLNTFKRDHGAELAGKRCAGVVVSGAPRESYADAPRKLLGRGAAEMPVLHLTTKQVADDAELDAAVSAFCAGLTA